MELNEIQQLMLQRIEEAGLKFNDEQKQKYLEMPDVLEHKPNEPIPVGYKQCGHCKKVKKFYLFNRNSSSKTNTTGNCKECQKEASKKSYQKTKQRRNYKEYYHRNKEKKQAHSRKYYQANKEKLLEKHKQYRRTSKGKEVMRRAHAKRREVMQENKGIPYTREMVIERDTVGKYPICYYCEQPIKQTSGEYLHIDHVIPISLGGSDCFSNVACMHAECNLKKKKDGTDITAQMISRITQLTEQYIDEHPEFFEDI